MSGIEWRYREHQGANDAVAPQVGGYWIADLADLDLIARIWPDIEAGNWIYDVTEADEIEYHGTPCIRDTELTLDMAKDAVNNYVNAASTK